MKKVLVGIIVGLILALPIGAHAEEIVNMIGKQVQGSYPVKLNNQTLDSQAVVIDGTSYLPVRAISDALGLDVTFDANLGISMTNKPVAELLNPNAERGKKIVELQQTLRKAYGELEILGEPVDLHRRKKATDSSLPDDEAYLNARKAYEDKQAQYKEIDDELQKLLKEQTQLSR